MKAENENRLRRAGVRTREMCVHRNAVRGENLKAGGRSGIRRAFFPESGEVFLRAFLREKCAVEHCFDELTRARKI